MKLKILHYKQSITSSLQNVNTERYLLKFVHQLYSIHLGFVKIKLHNYSIATIPLFPILGSTPTITTPDLLKINRPTPTPVHEKTNHSAPVRATFFAAFQNFESSQYVGEPKIDADDGGNDGGGGGG